MSYDVTVYVKHAGRVDVDGGSHLYLAVRSSVMLQINML